MKLLRVHIIDADTCGGLLADLDIGLRAPLTESLGFQPLCLIGPNGAGKSQFLQVLAEMFQSLLYACVPDEERLEGNPDLQFEVEYAVRMSASRGTIRVRVSRLAEGKGRPTLKVEQLDGDEWTECDLKSPSTLEILPLKIVGYTSGDNETLSLPFLISRSGYAQEVGEHALREATSGLSVPDTRLMLIDYGTHLEVLVANLLLDSIEQRDAILRDLNLEDLHSFRCIVQLAHADAPKVPKARAKETGRKGVQLTKELEIYLQQLQRCSTCYEYDPKTETYIFDYWINDHTRAAFQYFWNSTLDLYSALHKLSMLNDLALPRDTRQRFRRDTRNRHFASRLPEPQDEHKIFRFEEVKFHSKLFDHIVDYVSLSDGEHQLAQILGTMCMVSYPRVLFLLDEPESHFNPDWRVKFISRILSLPTANGTRGESGSGVAEQDCILTTHSPFVPSDMPQEQVFIFSKEANGLSVRFPDVETFGATFNTIVSECFSIRPPISDVPKKLIDTLMDSNDPNAIQEGVDQLGESVQKVLLVEHLHRLSKTGES